MPPGTDHSQQNPLPYDGSDEFREAGRADVLFSDDAVALVHQVSRGLPRAVNNLATQALVAAYVKRKSVVDESSARMAAAEVDAE